MPRILVVDDSPMMTRLLDYMLTSAGYETATASSGQAALDSVAQAPPDMIFLDIMMPDIDGVEVLRRIRQNPRTAAIPVVMLTAKAHDNSRQEALRAGANGYLTKPYTSEQVLAAVVNYCGPA